MSVPQEEAAGEDALIKECQGKWADLQSACVTLQEKRVTTTASDEDTAQIGIYRAKKQLLQAQINIEQSALTKFPSDKNVQQHLLVEELSQSVKELGETENLIGSQYTELQAELEKEKMLNRQHKSIKQTLRDKLEEVQLPQAEIDETALIKENEELRQKMHRYSTSLLVRMVRFLEEHFKSPSLEDTIGWLRKQGEHIAEEDEDTVQPFLSLQSILEDLMNQCMDTPHDPYIELHSTKHWPPYVQLLLRCGIVLRHPEVETKIRLTPFHI